MARDRIDNRINNLFHRGAWEKARELLEEELARAPDKHRILTQLGVTFYEQRRYKEALPLFLASREIVADCPLTLWHFAGTLDALGKHAEAIKNYTCLLESKKTSEDDSCWENPGWAQSLKTDSVYRAALCFEKQGKKETAELWFRRFVDRRMSGIDGSYTIDDAMRHLRQLQHNEAAGELP